MSLSHVFNVWYRTREQVEHDELLKKQAETQKRYGELVAEFRDAFWKGKTCLVKVFEPDCPPAYAEHDNFKETLEYMKQKDSITVMIEKYKTSEGDKAARYCVCYNKN